MILHYFVRPVMRSTSVGIFSLLLLFSSISLSAQTDPVTRVRAVQIVPDAPAVDVYLDDVTPASITGVKYLDVSRSLRLPPGTHNVKIAASGAPKETAVINQNIAFNNDTAYTIFATGRLGALNVQPVILTRWLGLAPTPGRSMVRVLQGSLEAGNVDITITDAIGAETNLSSLAFRSSSTYTPIPAGQLDVLVRAAGGEQLYKATGNIPQGALLTIVAVGDPGASTFKLSVLFDSDSLARSPMDTLRAVSANPLGGIRFVQASSKLGTVDIMVDNQGAVPDLAFRDASGVQQRPAGTYEAAAIDQTGVTVVLGDVDVIADLSQTAFVVGRPQDGNSGFLVLTTDGSAQPAAGKSSIRLVNTSTDVGIVNIEIEHSDASKRQIDFSGFRNFTPYQSATPGLTTVRVTQVDSASPILVASGTIPAGAIGTLILNGTVEEGNLGVNLLLESDQAAQTPMILFQTMTGVGSRARIISRMEVVPNPASDRATLVYAIGRPATLSYMLYSVAGEKIADRELGPREAGEHRLRIDLDDLSAGSYVIVIRDDTGRTVGARQVVVW